MVKTYRKVIAAMAGLKGGMQHNNFAPFRSGPPAIKGWRAHTLGNRDGFENHGQSIAIPFATLDQWLQHGCPVVLT